MIPFHSLFPDLAQKECRCVHLMPQPGVTPVLAVEPDEYAFVEFYRANLACDCRRVLLQVIDPQSPRLSR